MATQQLIRNSKGVVFCTLEHQPQKGIIYVNWKGFVNDIEPSKQACLAIAEMIRATDCRHVVNDNREQVGPWPPINDWLTQVWLPALKSAGMERMAHIHSTNYFTQLSSQNALKNIIDGMKIYHFSGHNEAIKWLNESNEEVKI